MSWDTIILIVWLGVSVLLIWPIAVAMIDHTDKKHPLLGIDGEDWAFSIGLATFIAPFWPVALAPVLSYLVWRKIDKKTPRPRKRSPKP